jgi:hypothetical protein
LSVKRRVKILLTDRITSPIMVLDGLTSGGAMARSISATDMALLREVARLGAQGKNPSEIARELDQALPTLRSRVERHGLEMAPIGTELRSKIGGIRLSELLARGELVEAEAEGVAA